VSGRLPFLRESSYKEWNFVWHAGQTPRARLPTLHD
jgi:hypothetical protein